MTRRRVHGNRTSTGPGGKGQVKKASACPLKSSILHATGHPPTRTPSKPVDFQGRRNEGAHDSQEVTSTFLDPPETFSFLSCKRESQDMQCGLRRLLRSPPSNDRHPGCSALPEYPGFWQGNVVWYGKRPEFRKKADSCISTWPTETERGTLAPLLSCALSRARGSRKESVEWCTGSFPELESTRIPLLR